VSDRKTQQQRILALLRSKEWVTLPEMMQLFIASRTARITELRHLGYQIECVTERVNGETRSKYRLVEQKELALQ